MVTRDVLKVLKLHSPMARAILRTFKTSLETDKSPDYTFKLLLGKI